jgi:hypothetical protein
MPEETPKKWQQQHVRANKLTCVSWLVGHHLLLQEVRWQAAAAPAPAKLQWTATAASGVSSWLRSFYALLLVQWGCCHCESPCRACNQLAAAVLLVSEQRSEHVGNQTARYWLLLLYAASRSTEHAGK